MVGDAGLAPKDSESEWIPEHLRRARRAPLVRAQRVALGWWWAMLGSNQRPACKAGVTTNIYNYLGLCNPHGNPLSTRISTVQRVFNLDDVSDSEPHRFRAKPQRRKMNP